MLLQGASMGMGVRGFEPPAGGGGGGGTTPDLSFNGDTRVLAEAARDAYFVANPAQLTNARRCWLFVGTPTPTDAYEQIYSTDAVAWLSQSTPVTLTVHQHYTTVLSEILTAPPTGPVEEDTYIAWII